MTRRHFVHFQMLVVQAAAVRDSAGNLEDNLVRDVRLAFAEVPDSLAAEAREYVMVLAMQALMGEDADATLARAYMTLYKAVTR